MKIFYYNIQKLVVSPPHHVQNHIANLTVKLNLSAKWLLARMYIQNNSKSFVLLQQTVARLELKKKKKNSSFFVPFLQWYTTGASM